MRIAVLCEGKTDAILLSYLLNKKSGWTHTVNGPDEISIKSNDINDESVNWYKRNEDFLLICGVGGKDKFKSFFSDLLSEIILNYTDEMSFDKLVYIIDRDENDLDDMKQKIINDLQPICSNIIVGKWTANSFINKFDARKEIEILGLIIPPDQVGALETTMLIALSENAYDKNIVDKSIVFVDDIKLDASKYIGTKRMQLKAKLSTVFAIISPQRVFSKIDKLIKSIDWEKYDHIISLFGELINI